MIKSITNFLIIFFIFQQLKSQISQIDQNGYNAFCDETLHIYRQYPIHCSALFMAWLVEHCSVDLRVGSSNPRIDDFFFIFFFLFLYFFMFYWINKITTFTSNWTVIAMNSFWEKKSVADRIYEDPEGTCYKEKIYWVITYVCVHGRKIQGGGGHNIKSPPPPTNLGIGHTYITVI